MEKGLIILSSGCLPWMGIKKIADVAIKTNFDGIELLPSRAITKDILEAVEMYGKDKWLKNLKGSNSIKSIHHSWRLDNAYDKEYGIEGIFRIIFLCIRFIFFPSVKTSLVCIYHVSKSLRIPLTVHNTSKKWTKITHADTYPWNIDYEIVSQSHMDKTALKKWLKNKKHRIVLDTRDDQSLAWAKLQGFKNWKDFWIWLGFSKIANLQITLIGKNAMGNILNHRKTLAEEQLLWLHQKKWKGQITLELNPLTLFILSNGNIQKGLLTISEFIRVTYIEGKKWSR